MPPLANSLKGASARRLRPHYTGNVNRTRVNDRFSLLSYLAASCGGAPPSIICQYIQEQCPA